MNRWTRGFVMGSIGALCCSSGLLGAEPFMPWREMKNPVVSPQIVSDLTGRETNSLKDAAVYYAAGEKMFYIFFSDFFNGSDLVGIKTADWQTFTLVLNRKDGCSPDLVNYEGTYYITYQTGYGYELPGKTIWYTTSRDLGQWSEPIALASNLTGTTRSIDAATALHKGTCYLVWKFGHDPYMAKAPSITSQSWQALGGIQGGWAENYQFINLDGHWYVVATAENENDELAPVIITLKGDADQDAHWLDWRDRRMLSLPLESWNPKTPHNAVYLADWRAHDGFYYVIYCGQDACCVGNYGFRLGMARSTDLLTWYAPGDTTGESSAVVAMSQKPHLSAPPASLRHANPVNLQGRLIPLRQIPAFSGVLVAPQSARPLLR